MKGLAEHCQQTEYAVEAKQLINFSIVGFLRKERKRSTVLAPSAVIRWPRRIQIVVLIGKHNLRIGIG